MRLTAMLQDLRLAVRALVKTPGYTIVALLALALGIGANTAIYSFVDAVLLRPLPYPQPERLYVPVSVNVARQIDRGSVTYADYEDWQRETDVFAAVAVFQPGVTTLTGSGVDPERAEALFVTGDYFDLIRIRPLAGRTLQAADQQASTADVTVISYGLWQRRFGGDPSVVGKTISVSGVTHEIVGVLGPRAAYPEDTQLFLPLVPSRFGKEGLARRDNMMFQSLARLADGVSKEQADARLQAIAARLAQENPESRKGWSNVVLPLRDYIVEPEFKIALYVLFAAVGAVLLIACANVANLTLVRGAGRAREIGVRLALGANRSRVVRQLLSESLVLAIAGGLGGVAVAALAIDGLIAMAPPGAPFIEHAALDARVIVAALAVTILTVVFVGVMPALSASGIELTSSLREGGRGSSHGRRTGRLRAGLVIAEIAAAVVLLVAAGLLVQSLGRLTGTPPGADLDRVLAARIGLPGSRYTPPQRSEFYRTLMARLAAEPGVQAAAATSFLPVGGGGFGLGRVFLAEGWPEPPAGRDVDAMWTVVTPDYFRALGIPLIRGRVFEDRDRNESTPVMIVGESFAARMFPNGNAIGQRVRSWRDENVYREIVGIVADVPFDSLADRGQSMIYVPHAQQGWGGMTIALRAASGDPELLTNTLRRVVSSLDPELALADIGTMEVFARNSIARERLSAMLMSVLALVALTLAVIGIYGVMSYSVSTRQQEMGVRLALGAAPGDLYRLILTRGLSLTGAGLVLGLGLALAASRIIGSLLYETSAFDVTAYGGMTLVLGATAFLACFLPARRAATADPMIALRSE